jgi:hypothetical protein
LSGSFPRTANRGRTVRRTGRSITRATRSYPRWPRNSFAQNWSTGGNWGC